MATVAPSASALLLQWSLHQAVAQAPFAPFSLGERLIQTLPGGGATAAIDVLGEVARPLLFMVIVVGALGLGFFLRHRRAVTQGLALGLVSAAASVLNPIPPEVGWLLASSISAGLAALATAYLLTAPQLSSLVSSPRFDIRSNGRNGTRFGRRRFLVALGLFGSALVLFGTAARRALEFVGLEPVRADRPASVPVDAAFDELPGLTPAITSRASHYVVDVNLDPPMIDPGQWRLRVEGAVSRPLALTFGELRQMPTVEQLSTLSCISNTVGGELVGNSLWTGVPVPDLLRLAGASQRVVAIKMAGADGYTDNIPIELASRPDTLVAIGMDGATLPIPHGYPARLLVPGLYGMKNVKWLTSLVCLKTSEDGYWEKRGWDRVARIRTESRFDRPAEGAEVRTDFIAAGIAWAGDRRISRVEVSSDQGRSWRAARLELELGPLSWRRWQIGLHLPVGDHTLTVRAFDGTGQAQESERRPPHPAGASGYHQVAVRVR